MALAMFAEELILHSHDNRLEFAPQIHFISGQPLVRLRNAAEVPFDFQATLWSANRTHVFRNADRFVVSFDVWQEQFSVTKTKAPQKTAAHLSAADVESWCVREMAMDAPAWLTGSEPFWARLEVRAENPEREGG